MDYDKPNCSHFATVFKDLLTFVRRTSPRLTLCRRSRGLPGGRFHGAGRWVFDDCRDIGAMTEVLAFASLHR